MATKIISIPEEVCNKVQALQYECNARQGLLAFMLDRNDQNLESLSFKTYHKEYTDFNSQYEKAKEDMQKQILEPQIPGKLLSWNLDFESRDCTCEYSPA